MVLFEREKALFPDTQPQVERILRMRDIREIIRELRSQLIRLLHMYNIPIPIVDDAHLDGHPDLREMHEAYTNALIEYEELRTGGLVVNAEERRFIRKCPNGACRGFMDEDWYCGMCRQHFCERCNGVRTGTSHECDPEAAKTMELLNADTKPCPKCGEMIQKTSGCSQMWCTMCETAFDWRTGVICIGKIHNPHYLEFRRKTSALNREHGDIPCGGLPSYQEIREYDSPYSELLSVRLSIARVEGELRWRWVVREDNAYLRVQYMLHEIDDEEFKKELQRRDKQNAKAGDVSQLFQMFLDTSSDELRQYLLGKDRREVLENIRSLTDYTNGVIRTIHDRYNCVTPYFIEKF